MFISFRSSHGARTFRHHGRSFVFIKCIVKKSIFLAQCSRKCGLYVESPAGVGFSTDSSSSSSSDATFATRTLAFLDHFLESHPRFQSSSVWLSGESYAGHYVTYLATEMLSRKDTSTISANLVGFMIGNAVTDDTFKYDGGSQFRTLYQHDFISDRAYSAVQTHCADTCNPWSNGFTSACPSCSSALRSAKIDITVYNLYVLLQKTSLFNNLYADVCRGRRRRQLEALIRHRERRTYCIFRRGRQQQHTTINNVTCRRHRVLIMMYVLH